MNGIRWGRMPRSIGCSKRFMAAAWMTLAACCYLAPRPAAAQSAGPVRMAHFTDVEGEVSWRPDDSAAWSQAARNLPVRQGCQIAVTGNGRGELQFDDGSRLQIGKSAVVTLTTLFSDANGEFSEITVRNGTAAVCLRQTPAVYQIDAPLVSVVASGPARLRVDTASGVQIAVHEGKCVVQGDQGKASLASGDYLDLRSKADHYDTTGLPTPDSFDNWTANRCMGADHANGSPHQTYLPSNIAIAADNLDSYGDWRSDPKYGHVWRPRVHDAAWRPYHDGRWTWVDPYGWTWVDNAPWGWAPSHYGTWLHESDGWCWDPGPAQQYWSPAVVNYCQSGDSVAWCPLAPEEVRYPPAVSIGFSRGDWSLFFSIGAAATYYPTNDGYCAPRPWRTDFVNNYAYGRSVRNVYVTNVNNYYGGFGQGGFNHNSLFSNQRFVPRNAQFAAGASLVAVASFGGRGSYRALPRDPRSIYAHARYIGAPAGSFAPVAGPPAARRTQIAMTPNRILRPTSPVSHADLVRPVHRVSGGAPQMVARQIVSQAPPQARRRPIAVTAPRMGASAQRPGLPVQRPGMPAQRIGATTAHPLTREQQSAMRARTALGVRPGTARPGARNGSAPIVVSPATARAIASRPNATSPRPGASPITPAQRMANQARASLGRRPVTLPSPRGANAVLEHARATTPTRPGAVAPAPSARRTPQNATAAGRRTMSGIHRMPPSAHTGANANRPRTLPAHASTAQVRRQPVTTSNRSPAHAYQRPVQHSQAQRRQTPAQVNRPARNNRQPVRAQRQYAPQRAPARTYRPPVHQQAPQVRQRQQAPQATERTYRPPVRIRRQAPPPEAPVRTYRPTVQQPRQVAPRPQIQRPPMAGAPQPRPQQGRPQPARPQNQGRRGERRPPDGG